MSAVLKCVQGLHPDVENSLWTYRGELGGLVLAGHGGGGAVCDGRIVISRAASGLEREVRVTR